MSIRFTDRANIGKTKRTSEGYLVATARIARTGIQEYRASELGFVGDHIVKVYRPESEVFHRDALQSLSRVPVTIDHPEELVTADNWKDLAVGEVGDEVMRDGDWLVVSPMLKDANALTVAETTHREISMGYTAELRDADPKTGADYEMYNLRFNHLALVPKGRAGSEARFGDSASWGVSPVIVEDNGMTVDVKTVILGDKAVQVVASDADTVAAILRDHAAAIADKDKEIGELTARLADAEAKVLTDEQLAEKVKALADATARREAVKARFGDDAVKDASDAMIEGMFRVLDKVPARSGVADALNRGVAEVDDAEARINAALKKHLKVEV